MLKNLKPEDQDVIFTCVRAMVDGPFVVDEFFKNVMGRGQVTRQRARDLLQQWDLLEDSSPMSDSFVLIHHTLNYLRFQLPGQPESVREWFGDLSKERIEAVFQAWCHSYPFIET